jgi:hypothetical protein
MTDRPLLRGVPGITYPVEEPMLNYLRPGEVNALLNRQRRNLRGWTVFLWIFAMVTIGSIMKTARVIVQVPELAWIAPMLPGVALSTMGIIGFFGILFVFGRQK